MRSSKSRSRSKGNRQRSMGNIVNRVFDSSGPEGKVRGTPQQIIDKYNQLARDAALGNDRVATENFQQHAEHYTRMLGEAQREQDARREQQEQQQRDRQRDRHDGNSGQGGQQQPQNQYQNRQSQEPEGFRSVEPDSDQPDVIEDEIQSSPQPDLLEGASSGGTDESGLVETPEGKAKPRRPRTRKPKAENAEGETATSEDQPRPKRTRKPKAQPEEAQSESAPSQEGDPSNSPEAAE